MMPLFSSCIEPVRPDLAKSDFESQLVVEGTITDEPGPFKVRLTRSGLIYTNQTVYKSEPVSGASVHITDDKGNDFHLWQGVNGWYETNERCLQGIPGNTYILHITDEDGNLFESSPEMMSEVYPIDSVFYEEEQRTSIKNEIVSHEDWLKVLLNTHAPDDGIHYFRWEFDETWEFQMPESIEVVRYDYDEYEQRSMHVFLESVLVAPEKLHCWITESARSILVKSTADNISGQVTRFQLTSIGPDDDRFSIRYSILVRQFSLNKELYDFFNRLKDLNEENGGIYNKNPAAIYGNIKNNSVNKRALGYFSVSAVKTKRIFINHPDVHIITGHSAYSDCGWTESPLNYKDYYFYGTAYSDSAEVWSGSKYCTDCRERGTNVKPDFW
jgi:hypothetical protein